MFAVFEDSKSEPDDPEVSLKIRIQQEKRKRANESSLGNIRKVRRVVLAKGLPNQSSAICRSIRAFARFLMGMPSTVETYPQAPTQQEWATWHEWTDKRYARIMKHMEDFLEKHKEVPKQNFKQLYSDELARIRKASAPPAFFSAPDVVNSELNISLNVKKACEQDIQFAGFGRITFEWDASSFSASLWNSTLGTIIIKHYHSWAKGQPGNLWGETGCMEKILDRWVQGQGKEMKRVGGAEGQSSIERKAEKARKASITRMKQKVMIYFCFF